MKNPLKIIINAIIKLFDTPKKRLKITINFLLLILITQALEKNKFEFDELGFSIVFLLLTQAYINKK